MKMITDVSQLIISGYYWATMSGYFHGLQLVQMLSDNALPEQRYFMYKGTKIKCPRGYDKILESFDFYGPVVAPGFDKIQEMRKVAVTNVPDNLATMPAGRTQVINQSIIKTISDLNPQEKVLQERGVVRQTFYKFIETSEEYLRPDGVD